MKTSVLLAAVCLLTACANKPGVAGNRESGQSRLMGQTFAGANKCNPENHLRPFIIEWDATDMSSFESYAANDIVFVKYGRVLAQGTRRVAATTASGVSRGPTSHPSGPPGRSRRSTSPTRASCTRSSPWARQRSAGA